jgi:AcrR family transcriptional regulator
VSSPTTISEVASQRAHSRKSADTRQLLIRAATEVVARQGFHSASVDAIARRAGFSIGALYWNFTNKDELFFAVFDEHVRWFERQLQTAADAGDPGDAAMQWIDLAASQPEQFLIFIEFWAYAVRKPKVRKAFAERMAQMREAIAETLRHRSAQAGAQPALPAEFVALIGLALGRGLALEKFADPEAVDDKRLARLIAGLVA